MNSMTLTYQHKPYNERPIARVRMGYVLLAFTLICICAFLWGMFVVYSSTLIVFGILCGIAASVAALTLLDTTNNRYRLRFPDLRLPSNVSVITFDAQGMHRNGRLLLEWVDVTRVECTQDTVSIDMPSSKRERYWMAWTFDLWSVQRYYLSALATPFTETRSSYLRRAARPHLPRRGYEPNIDLLEEIRKYLPAGLIEKPDRPIDE